MVAQRVVWQLPEELRMKIYDAARREDIARRVLGSSKWIGYCRALELKFNDAYDFRASPSQR